MSKKIIISIISALTLIGVFIYFQSSNSDSEHEFGDEYNIETPYFIAKGPGEWKYFELQGTDFSFIGYISNGEFFLEFEYGLYYTEFDAFQERENYTFEQWRVDNLEATVFYTDEKPTNSTTAVAITFDNLFPESATNYESSTSYLTTRFSLHSSQDLSQEQINTVLNIFKTIQFKEVE